MRELKRLDIDKVAGAGGDRARAPASFMTFATLRPNRLSSGEPYGLSVAGSFAIVVWVVIAVALVVSVVRMPRGRSAALLLSAAALATATAWAGGAATLSLLEGQTGPARVSVGSGAWGLLIAAAILFLAGSVRLEGARWVTAGAFLLGLAGVASAFLWGGLSEASLALEYQVRSDIFWRQVGEHLALTGAGLAIGLLIGVPLGIWAARSRRVRAVTLQTTSVIQTIPSLALLGLLIAPLAALVAAYPLLADLGVRGIGVVPAVIALTLYSLLPIVRNTYTGLIEVSPAAKDAGRGMGMNGRQLLGRVEVPLALPLMFEGVRIASVLLIGITALTALVGAGGLGVFIFEGLNQAAPDLILLGALPIVALAMVADRSIRLLAELVVPKGVRHT